MQLEELRQQFQNEEFQQIERSLQRKKDLFLETEKRLLTETGLLEKQKLDLEEQIQTLKGVIATLSEKIGPELERIQKWEQDLRLRERDINVIIERYRRLYGEHGTGFRI